MSFVGIRLPHETARILSEIEVPGEREPDSSYHVTLLYIGDNVSIDVLAEALKATIEVTSVTRPFTVSTSRVSSFPGGDSGVPVICPVDSDDLHELHAKLRASYDAHGVEYSKRFPEYKPHVTLAYSEEGIREQRIPTVEWGAHEIVLWGGDEGDKRLIMHFPLSLTGPRVEDRVASRFLQGTQLGKALGWLRSLPP